MKVALKGTTIPHEIIGKYGAGVVLLNRRTRYRRYRRRSVRAVVETGGIKDVRTKALRSNNPGNVVKATSTGFQSFAMSKR